MTKYNNDSEMPAADLVTDSPRRQILFGVGAVLVGGIAGRMSKAEAGTAPGATLGTAPPLPWPWINIDPMEAGTRTYKSYLTQGG
jgi:hypothetical protein